MCCVVVGAASVAALGAVSGSSAATVGPVLDNFACATATAAVPVPFSGTPAKVLLKNRVGSGGFVAVPSGVQLHCTPVQTTVGHGATVAITNPNADLLCLSIKSTAVNLPLLMTLKNQFGTGAIKLLAARSLCVPSWENGTSPPTFPTANAPSNLDAYVCYTATHPNGAPAFAVPRSVQLKDQFGTATTKVGAPNIVCVPTVEIVHGTSTRLVNPAHLSVCFATSAAPVTARTVYDKNQFGVGALKLRATTELCVPSLTVAVPPSTTTTAPTTTTTAVVTHVVTNYTDPSIADPLGIAAGPDGALWFTNHDYTLKNNGGSIGRITTSGVVTSYGDSTIANPDSITTGADGAIWFVNSATPSIGRITTDGTATITNYADPKIGQANRIIAGPYGAEWFTNESNSVGYVTSSGGVSTYTDPSIADPQGITAGADGALWFTNFGNNTIGHVTFNGNITHYVDPAIASPFAITSGPDGALWFTSAYNMIGRITTAGIVTTYTDPSISNPQEITTGADGALWFTNSGNNSIGRITTNGTITDYTDPTISSPEGITSGPDGAIWFTNSGNNSIGRISL